MGRLPFELEHKICEMAIDAPGYPILPTIILVARRFRDWSVFFSSLNLRKQSERKFQVRARALSDHPIW